MKLALLRNIKYDFEMVSAIDKDGEHGFGDEYIIVSEALDVDFKMIDVDLTKAKVDIINKDIEKAEAGIHLLKQSKAELLAITDMNGEA